MRFLFNDQSFSFEALRALGYAAYGGADVGEVVSTAGWIPDGDEAAWYAQWRALAERIHADADRAPPRVIPLAPGSPTCEQATTTGCASFTCASTRPMTLVSAK